MTQNQSNQPQVETNAQQEQSNQPQVETNAQQEQSNQPQVETNAQQEQSNQPQQQASPRCSLLSWFILLALVGGGAGGVLLFYFFFLKKNKTSWGGADETASPSPSSQQLTPPRPVIFAAVVKVKEFESKRNNPASLFGQAFFYWIGEQQQWKTTLQNMGIQKLPNDSELPANKEAELVVTYSTQWRGDLPKNSVAVQIALKKEQPSQSDIYQLPRECNIFNYGFQKG